MVRRYAKRRDENEPEIVKALLAVGCLVERNEPPLPDLTVGRHSRLYWLEVKADVDKPRNDRERRRGGLTKRQVEFHAKWGEYIAVVRTADEAIQAVMGRTK